MYWEDFEKLSSHKFQVFIHVQLTNCAVHCKVYKLCFTLYSTVVLYSLQTLQLVRVCKLYCTLQFINCAVHCTAYQSYCTLYSLQTVLYTVQF